jgi:uncharacterized coiled-coil DUF342 family protein
MKNLFYFLHSARRVANNLNAKVNDLQQENADLMAENNEAITYANDLQQENAALMAQNAVLKQQLAEVNNHFNTALSVISNMKQAQNAG